MKITTQKQAEQARKEIENLEQLYRETGEMLADYQEAVFLFDGTEELKHA